MLGIYTGGVVPSKEIPSSGVVVLCRPTIFLTHCLALDCTISCVAKSPASQLLDVDLAGNEDLLGSRDAMRELLAAVIAIDPRGVEVDACVLAAIEIGHVCVHVVAAGGTGEPRALL